MTNDINAAAERLRELKCIFCDFKADSLDSLKEHSADCREHPLYQFKLAYGQWQEKTEWHKVVAWAGLAEQAGKLVKGQQVYVEGSLETRKYTGKDGAEKYVTEVKARLILPIGKRGAETPKPSDDNDDPDMPY